MALKQLEEVDEQIERELEGVKKRIAVLREKRQASLKVYNAACTMLGKANHLADEVG